MDWIPAPSQGFAELIYVFDGGRLTPPQIESIRLPQDELTEHRFLALPDAVARLTAADGRRLTAACEAARHLAGSSSHYYRYSGLAACYGHAAANRSAALH